MKYTNEQKYAISVCEKGEKYLEPGKEIEKIRRVLRSEQIGNFNPLFCTYRGKRCLVQSRLGDVSDPFRREESYAETFFIEI